MKKFTKSLLVAVLIIASTSAFATWSSSIKVDNNTHTTFDVKILGAPGPALPLIFANEHMSNMPTGIIKKLCSIFKKNNICEIDISSKKGGSLGNIQIENSSGNLLALNVSSAYAIQTDSLGQPMTKLTIDNN